MTEHKNIAAALASAQAEMGRAIKDSNNPHFRSKYADLGNVMDACMPALTKHGIALIQPTGEDEAGRFVETVLIHSSGESLRCRVPLIVSKNDMQGYGSAVTYARRYGLMAMAGIAPEDDDGAAAAASPPRSEPKQQPAAFDPAPAIAKIESATTGRQLLDAVKAIGEHNARPDITEARRDRLKTIIQGAQETAVIRALERNFGPDWSAVKAAADAREGELTAPGVTESPVDLSGDSIPY